MTTKNNAGFTLIELLVVVAVIGIISAIAIPGLLRARMSGNEASAIGSIRSIVSAQAAYAGKCNGYASSLTELGTAGKFLSADMVSAATIVKSGYSITVAVGAGADPVLPLPAGCSGTQTGYYATAVPTTLDSTGTRSFASNAEGSIYAKAGIAAPSEPFDVTLALGQ